MCRDVWTGTRAGTNANNTTTGNPQSSPNKAPPTYFSNIPLPPSWNFNFSGHMNLQATIAHLNLTQKVGVTFLTLTNNVHEPNEPDKWH